MILGCKISDVSTILTSNMCQVAFPQPSPYAVMKGEVSTITICLKEKSFSP